MGRTVTVNLDQVQGWKSQPHGEYLGEITSAKWIGPREAGKFAQLEVTYTCIDEGDQLDQSSKEWLSFSPKAAGRMKNWFEKFGFGDTPSLVFDDGDEIEEPDILGSQVTYAVRPRRDDPTRDETMLLTVETVPETQPKRRAPAATRPAPTAARPAPRRAAPAPAEEELPGEEEAEEEEEVAEVPAPRRAAVRPAVAAPPARPVRRSLR